MLAHASLHRFNLTPGELFSMPRQERAFIFASLQVQLEKERKEHEQAKKKRRR